jgi:hypothetical protein
VFVRGGRRRGKLKDTIDHCEGRQKFEFELDLELAFELQAKLKFK